jgi:hypothetical protein
MIYTLAFHSKKHIKNRLSPQADTFVIQLSNPEKEIEINKGFYGVHNTTFLDDIYPTYKHQTLSIEQAKELTKILDKINSSPELIEVVICCDTGKTASAALALFTKERFPKTKAHQVVDKKLLNKNVLSTMRICTYKGVTLSGVDAGLQSILDTHTHTIKLIQRIKSRSAKNNVVAMHSWLKSNF